jgi:peptidoglycan hydrolase-like protein with peptidoglycan-binding domain
MSKGILRKLILPFGLALVLPMMVLAADEVSFADVVNVFIADPGTTLQISPGSLCDQIVVDSDKVTFTLSTNSTVTITSTDRYVLTNTLGISTNCGSSTSDVTLTGSGAVEVDPGDVCAVAVGGGAAGAPTPTAPTVPTTTTGQVTATASAGGKTTVTSDENVTASAELPANAVTADTTVVITPTTKTATAVSSAVAAVPATRSIVGGNVYNYSATSAGAAVTTFEESVTLSLTYTEGQIGGLDEATLKVYYWDETISSWVGLTSVVNTTTKTVTASVSHFTYFVLMGEASAEVLGVSSISPVSDATDVAVDTNIIITFTKDLDETTVTTDSVKLVTDSTSVAGAVSVSEKTITFDPTEELSFETVYTVTLTTDIKATDETVLSEDYSSSFTTAAEEAEEVTKPISEMTVAELKAEIARIAALIADLQAQLLEMIGGAYEGCTITSFSRNLQVGMTGDDVKCLQIILNSSADTQVASSGVGSSGSETTYFGSLTKAAVIKFQEKYAEDVLTPWGLTSGTGFVGSTTLEKLNDLLGG